MSRTHIPAALRRRVHERARGCCEYCGIPETACFVPHEVDHVVAEQHGGTTSFDNLALACFVCNKRKGPNLASIDPASGTVTPLFNPRIDDRTDHLLLLRNGDWRALTNTGRATVFLLDLNHPDRIQERRLLIAAHQI
jgi:hypothetical protein